MGHHYVLFPMIVVVLVAACTEQPEPSEPIREPPVPEMKIRAVIVTSRGKINLDLYASKVPLTVANFVNLAQREFYDGLTFHRVIPYSMIQGGCPLGDGTGGPGYRFQDEFRADVSHDKAGTLSMANSGPGTNGSQFFITHVPAIGLDGRYTVFGSIVSDADLEVVNAIVWKDTIERIEIEGDTAPLMAQMADQVAAWNKVLDKSMDRR